MNSKNKVYICKPGCNLQPKPNKTNLQIREMEAMQSALALSDVHAELVTIDYIIQHLEYMSDAKIICFNSAACFNHELSRLINACCFCQRIDLTLISNDCRLNFNVKRPADSQAITRFMRKVQSGVASCRILTNASKSLLDYRDIVLDWPHKQLVPIYHSELWTLPSFMPGAADNADKTVSAVFACMHFCDYSDKRKQQLVELRQYFGDKLVLTGDMSGMIVDGAEIESTVTDTATVWQWYKHAKTTPVLLEPNYDQFGVMPNRVSEAIACRCMPILSTEDIQHYAAYADLPLPACDIADTLPIIMLQYIEQYDDTAVQHLLDMLQRAMDMHRQLFVQQLTTLFKVNIDED